MGYEWLTIDDSGHATDFHYSYQEVIISQPDKVMKPTLKRYFAKCRVLPSWLSGFDLSSWGFVLKALVI